MENSSQETTALIPAAQSPSLVAATVTDVNLNENHKNKHKLYKQHFLALSERCKVIQQVKPLTAVLVIF